jgi:hypothetical protein
VEVVSQSEDSDSAHNVELSDPSSVPETFST